MKGKEHNYNIIASGSDGNCVIVNRIMFDAGVSYRTIKKYLYNIDYLVITHIHTDHLKVSTVKRIKKEFPKIMIIGNYEVARKIKVDIIAINNIPIMSKDFEIHPFELVHDCENTGFAWTDKGTNFIFATDTVTLKNAPKLEYDYLFLESNHDINKVKKAQEQYTSGYKTYIGSLRHLSTQEAKTFYYMNRRNKHSKFIELHKSKRFY